MAKIAASFEQEQADAVVAELSRMNIDGLEWRVDDPSDGGAGSWEDATLAAAPASMAGNGVRAADGAPALAAPILAAGADESGDLFADSGEDYLHQARRRGATVITVDLPSDAEAAVTALFERYNASHITSR